MSAAKKPEAVPGSGHDHCISPTAASPVLRAVRRAAARPDRSGKARRRRACQLGRVCRYTGGSFRPALGLRAAAARADRRWRCQSSIALLCRIGRALVGQGLAATAAPYARSIDGTSPSTTSGPVTPHRLRGVERVLSDEEGSGRTRACPPICAPLFGVGTATRAVPEWLFCRADKPVCVPETAGLVFWQVRRTTRSLTRLATTNRGSRANHLSTASAGNRGWAGGSGRS
jgi:hypothetical protein